MQSKGAIKLLAILLAIACIYQLSFSFKTRSVEKKAAAYAAEGLSSAAVIYDKQEDKIILVYTGRQKDSAEIMNALKSRLPDYMLPQKIIRIKAMPINANGKTDRKWLTANYKNI